MTPSRPRSRCALALATALSLAPVGVAAAADGPRWATATAEAETPSNYDDEAGGNADADDPAVWVHPDDGDASVVLGALKNGGLGVYDLAGEQLQALAAGPAPEGAAEPGRFNNVDVVLGVRVGGRVLDLAVVTDRGRDRLRFYAVDPRGARAGDEVLRDVTSPDVQRVFSADEAAVDDQQTAYGLAAGVDPDGEAVVLATRRHTTDYATLRLVPGPQGTVGYEVEARASLPESFVLPGGQRWTPCEEPGEEAQMEGSVYDAAHDRWYVAQEDVGIWRVARDGNGFRSHLVDRVRGYGVPAAYDDETEECAVTGPDPGQGGVHLTADAEGLTLAQRADGSGYLFASSQGDSTFAVYSLEDGTPYVGGFAVADGAGERGAVDGVQSSDGAQVVVRGVGEAFPHGLLVVHDGGNSPATDDDEGEERADTDFKLVPLERVVDPLGLDL